MELLDDWLDDWLDDHEFRGLFRPIKKFFSSAKSPDRISCLNSILTKKERELFLWR